MEETRFRLLPIIVTLSLLTAAGWATRAHAARTQGQAAPQAPARQAGHGTGQLVIWGDLAMFYPPGNPQSCLTMNRYKRGEPVGFRMTAVDGGTGEVENTAVLVAHVTSGGKTVDVPMRFRGSTPVSPNMTFPNAPGGAGYMRQPVELWTGKWIVPNDAPIGMVTYTVTATDAFGRKATFTPFPYSTSQLTIVQ